MESFRPRPFSLAGYRTTRAIYNEDAAESSSQLYLVVAPAQKAIATEHKIGERCVLELGLAIAIMNAEVDSQSGASTSELFNENTVLAVHTVAGYTSVSDEDDGNVAVFNVMLPFALEQLYQVVRSKAIELSFESGFDASHIPNEIDAQVFSNQAKPKAPKSGVAPKNKRPKKAL